MLRHLHGTMAISIRLDDSHDLAIRCKGLRQGKVASYGIKVNRGAGLFHQ